MDVLREGRIAEATQWLREKDAVRSVVLYGSLASKKNDGLRPDARFDIDLHVIALRAQEIFGTHFSGVFDAEQLILQARRQATGGMKKIVSIYKDCDVEIVVLPYGKMCLARVLFSLGMAPKFSSLFGALNEMKTSIRTGYRFLKGERDWGRFYSMVEKMLPGVRINDDEARNLADIFLCDILTILRRIEAGELVASQYLIHRNLNEVYLRLFREFCLREGRSVRSFGLGRGYERSLGASEYALFQVCTGLDVEQLRGAAFTLLGSLQVVMSNLVPDWKIPDRLPLSEYRKRRFI